MRTTLPAAALLALSACAAPAPRTIAPTCTAPLEPAIQVDLYFGLATRGRQIDEAEWAAFLDEEVTPRFPDGLSVIDVAGQYRGPTGHISREPSKLLVVVVSDASVHRPKVRAVVDAYRRRFDQLSVLHVEHAVCAAY